MQAIDLMDRTAGHADWIVVRPFPTFPSNCVVPALRRRLRSVTRGQRRGTMAATRACASSPIYWTRPGHRSALRAQSDRSVADQSARRLPGPIIPASTRSDRANNGEGFDKDLGGNELPNAPHFTATVTADYTLPLPSDWLMTLHTDLYYQSEAWTRIFNTPGYDKLKAYTNINLAAIFTNEDAGWKVMAYVKNVFDQGQHHRRLPELRRHRPDHQRLPQRAQALWPAGHQGLDGRTLLGGFGANARAGEPYPLTVELGGQVQRQDAPYEPLAPSFTAPSRPRSIPLGTQNRDLDWGDGREVRLTYPAGGRGLARRGRRPLRQDQQRPTSRLQRRSGRPPVCMLGPECPVADSAIPTTKVHRLSTDQLVATSRSASREDHLIADFAVGHDVGIGRHSAGQSKLSRGLRYAEFRSQTAATLDGVPDLRSTSPSLTVHTTIHHWYDARRSDAEREFGAPARPCRGTVPGALWGDERLATSMSTGRLRGGVLFGKQKTTIHGHAGIDRISSS